MQNYQYGSRNGCVEPKTSSELVELAYHHMLIYMLIIFIIYNYFEMFSVQNYAELLSQELQLLCTTWKKSRTRLRTLAYYCIILYIILILYW